MSKNSSSKVLGFPFHVSLLAVALTSGCRGPSPSAAAASAEDERHESAEDEAREQLGRAIAGSKVSLEAGMRASEAQGEPISAKFELEEGHLQLSVYTMKGGAYAEVIVDHETGAVSKTKPITDGHDFEAATKQSDAVQAARGSLRAAAERALATNPGFKLASAFPAIEAGHPVASVTIVQGEDFKTIAEALQP